jgi:gliding motility-associated-like protein
MYACGKGYVSELINPVPNILTITTTHPSSCSTSDGSATANMTCSVGPFSYSWSNGATTQTITGLGAGVYKVTVTDNSSCPPRLDTAIVNLIGKPGYSVSVEDTNLDCKHLKGNSTAYPIGGTPPYTYKWSNGATTQTATGLSAGTYSCEITDNTGCNYFITTTIINIPPPTIIIYPTGVDSICSGTSVSITALGAENYTWSPNAGLSCNNCSSPMVSPTVNTTYTISGIDSNGCSASATFTMKIIPAPKLIITGRDTVCLGSQDTLNVTGGTNYFWGDGRSGSPIYLGPVYTDSTFIVFSTNSYGCTGSDTFTVVVDEPKVSIKMQAACGNLPVVLQAVVSGKGPFTYSWSPGGGTASHIIVPDSIATYNVKVTSACGSTSNSITVTPDTPHLISCCDETILLGDDTMLYASGVKSYLWEPSAGLTCDTCPNIIVSPTVTTTYTIIGTDSMGCQTEETITIVVDNPCANLIIPNVFTPNYAGRSKEDNVFYIKTTGLDSWSVSIYDRWGKEMFSTFNLENYWDGNTKNGEKAPTGVYYYIINETCMGKTHIKDGFVQLIR